MAIPLRVLILEDRPADAELMLHELRRAGFDPDWRRVETEPDYSARLDPALDIILADYALPQFDALRALRLLQERRLDIPFIVVTGSISEEAAVECMKQGAADYLLKDRLTRLGRAVAHELEQKQVRGDKRQAEEALRVSEERLRTFLTATPDLVFLKDPEYRHVFANQALAIFFGKPIEEVVGKTDYDLMPAQAAENCRRSDIRALAEKRAITTEEIVGNSYFETVKFPVPLGDKREGIGGFIRDITERKRAEQALHDSEERFSAFMNHLPAVVFIKDQENRLQYANQYLVDLFGFEDWLGKSTAELLPKEVARAMAADDQQALAEGALIKVETITDRKGTERVFHTCKFPIKREGKPPLLGGISVEITEQKRAEEALRESERKLRDAQAIGRIGNWEFDIDRGTLEWSDETYELYERDPALGPPTPDEEAAYYAPEQAATLREYARRAIETGEEFKHDLQARLPSARPAFFSASMRPNRDESGRVVKLFGTVQDITERKRAEEALQASEERFRIAAQSASDLIHEWNIVSGRLDWFGDIDKFLGYAQGEFPRTVEAWEQAIHSDDHDRVMDSIERHLKAQAPFSEEYRVRRKDGAILCWVDRGTAVRDEQGAPYKWIGACTDVTQRKRAEEQIEASLREKEALLKEIHHRVKNNLQIISSLLSLQAGYISDQRALDAFKDSQNRIRSMALVHEKLYQSPNLAWIDFAEYVQGMVTQLFHSYGITTQVVALKTNVQGVFLSIDTAIPCGLIISELVSNCLKHAFPPPPAFAPARGGDRGGHPPAGGKEGRREVCVELYPEGDKIMLTVSDNGIGFPPEVDFRDTQSLGLQLVTTLTRQLKGDIQLDTRNGTTFKITFAERA